MVSTLQHETVWTDRQRYEDAERAFYERKFGTHVQSASVPQPVAVPVCNASRPVTVGTDSNPLKHIEDQIANFQKIVSDLQFKIDEVGARVKKMEDRLTNSTPSAQPAAVTKKEEQDDDVDLFGSDSEEDEGASEAREKLLEAYAAKKAKKPVLIAKSNIILDVKPWDDETDMKQMEAAVRQISMDGLLWGAAKLVPLAYGIHKLQISCVVEDDLVSVDSLQEQIEAIEDYVQSVDIAAFNKV